MSCRAAFPHGRSLVERLKDEPFALIGVNGDPDPEEARRQPTLEGELRLEKVPWRSFADGAPDGPIAREWKVGSWPTLYLIDAAGRIRHRWIGDPGAEVLDAAIEALIAETKRAGAPGEPSAPSERPRRE